jgi:molybdopterin-guanine dinucleotide biosynthesis protein
VRIAAVSGTCSRAGKTALAVSLLRAMPRGAAAAVKFTTAADVFERCPRGSACAVCGIEVPFRVILDPAVIREPGTDTDRLAEAGANRVIWAISRETAAAEAWAAVARVLGDGLVVLEGSSVVARGLARPALALFVAHRATPPERWKPTSDALIAAADRVIVHAAGGSVSPAVLAGLEARGGAGRVTVADVTRPLAEWAPDLAERTLGVAAATAAAR